MPLRLDALRGGGRRRWWAEAAIVAAFYIGYGRLRALAAGSAVAALVHARQVIRFERFTGLFHEARVQRWFLGDAGLLRVFNVYYGLIHFVVPGVALVVLWWRWPDRYRTWRNTLGLMLLVALAGFWLYPLMPPRLLPAPFHFVDTAAKIGGIGPIGASEGAGAANLFAAMPSLHVGWSTWCTFALWPLTGSRLLHAALVAYPVATLLVVVVTANHYVLDGVGGVIALALARGGVALVDRRLRANDARRAEHVDASTSQR